MSTSMAENSNIGVSADTQPDFRRGVISTVKALWGPLLVNDLEKVAEATGVGVVELTEACTRSATVGCPVWCDEDRGRGHECHGEHRAQWTSLPVAYSTWMHREPSAVPTVTVAVHRDETDPERFPGQITPAPGTLICLNVDDVKDDAEVSLTASQADDLVRLLRGAIAIARQDGRGVVRRRVEQA